MSTNASKTSKMNNAPSVAPHNIETREAEASGLSPRYPRFNVTATGLSVVYKPEGLEPILK